MDRTWARTNPPRCDLTVSGPLAGSVLDTMRDRFDVACSPGPDTTALTLPAIDQAAVRAVLLMLWDSGHQVLTMSVTPAGPPRPANGGVQ